MNDLNTSLHIIETWISSVGRSECQPEDSNSGNPLHQAQAPELQDPPPTKTSTLSEAGPSKPFPKTSEAEHLLALSPARQPEKSSNGIPPSKLVQTAPISANSGKYIPPQKRAATNPTTVSKTTNSNTVTHQGTSVPPIDANSHHIGAMKQKEITSSLVPLNKAVDSESVKGSNKKGGKGKASKRGKKAKAATPAKYGFIKKERKMEVSWR